MTPKGKSKQVVLLIHGIGEQKPMDSLRSFAHTIAAEEQVELWYKQEEMTDFLDGRRIGIPGNRNRLRTDFLELYWADLGIQHKRKHVYRWLISLLFRNPFRLSYKLIAIWGLSWLLVLLFGLGLLTGLISLPTANPEFDPQNLLLPLLGILVYVFYGQLINYVGDAARYFDAHPENVKFRNDILKRGIGVLKKLHNSKQYERIIIVGHSLGSVIGYDLIRNFWGAYHEKHEKVDLKGIGQPALAALEKQLKQLKENPTRKNRKRYKRHQALLWKEQKELVKNGWLISDSITLGSPLAHASFLMGSEIGAFVERKNNGEYPSCPPHLGNNALSYTRAFTLDNGATRNISVLNDTAPFSVVSWVNLYFPGDIIGGPLIPVFGAGIRDVKVFADGLRAKSWFWTSHVLYWLQRPLKDRKESLSKGSAIKELIIALDLNFQRLEMALEEEQEEDKQV